MGFLDELIEFVAPVVEAFVPGVAPLVDLLTGEDPDVVKRIGGTGLVGLKAKPAAIAAVQKGIITPKLLAATGRLKNIVMTTVETIAPDGTIVDSEVLKGSPWLMRSDFVIMKRVLRTITAGEKRIPRKSVKSRKAEKELALMSGVVKGLLASGGHHGHGGGTTIIDT